MHTFQGTGKAIIYCLSENPGLTVKQTYHRILPVIPRPISYQAVHKKIMELEQVGVVERKNNLCFLSNKWLAEMAMLAQHAMRKIEIINDSMTDYHTIAEIREYYIQRYTNAAGDPNTLYKGNENGDWYERKDS